MSKLIELTDKEYRLIRDLIYNRFGINLTEQKKPLIVGRLQKELRRFGLSSFTQYYEHVIRDKTGEALITLVNRISTNHTFFNREAEHFKFFSQKVLPEIKRQLAAAHQKQVRIWCAGCSSGEEAYMLSMLLHQFFRLEINSWDVRLLATDISNRVLEIAKLGIYTDDNVDHLPGELKNKYFTRMPSGDWKVNDPVRKLISYGSLNLMRQRFPFKGQFQAIFCRNVMIYFDNRTKHALVRRFFEYTQNQGYLFIGHSETLSRNECPYEYVMPAVYHKEIQN